MSALRQLDPRALADAIVLAAVIVGPAAAVSFLVVDRDADDGGGALSLVFIALILVGFGIGGRRVARAGVVLPLTHGAFVGLLTFAAVQVLILVLSAIAGNESEVRVASLAFSALLASSAGMIGASLGLRRTTWRA